MSEKSSRNATVVYKGIHIYLCVLAVQKRRSYRHFERKNAPKHNTKYGGK